MANQSIIVRTLAAVGGAPSALRAASAQATACDPVKAVLTGKGARLAVEAGAFWAGVRAEGEAVAGGEVAAGADVEADRPGEDGDVRAAEGVPETAATSPACRRVSRRRGPRLPAL